MKLNGIIMIAAVGSVLSSCGWQKSKEESQKVQTVQTNNVNTEETRAISATEVSQTTALELEQTTQTQELTELVTEEGTIWNQQKAKQLGQYMEIWGQERNQNYQAYQPGHSVAFYTIQVPDDLLSYEPKIQPAIGNNPIWLNWSETGSEGGYCLVAVYSDSATQVAQKHVYLFTLVNGEAKVYVSKEQPAEEQPYLFLKETSNTELKEQFTNLVNNL